ncbi:hypothetical protein, partial [Campylobacter sp.]|uniref:hypothetical protein n=1 Tax=Campylobacter sp. TaxID=205 RepID=UPI002AA820B0
ILEFLNLKFPKLEFPKNSGSVFYRLAQSCGAAASFLLTLPRILEFPRNSRILNLNSLKRIPKLEFPI